MVFDELLPSSGGTPARSSVPSNVFRLNADLALVAIANLASDGVIEARGAHNCLEAKPTLLLALYNLTTPIAFVADGPHAQRYKFDGRRLRPFDFCGE
jgi:hypothetical protein